jgi:hypothetical protein
VGATCPCLVAGPRASELLKSLRPTTIDSRLHEAEDGPLQYGGGKNRAPAVLAFFSFRRLLLVGGELPYLLEDDSSEKACKDAEQEAERTVNELGHRFREYP